MISLKIILSALMLFVLMAHVSAYWGSSGFFGQTNPRFRSSYYSPNYGHGVSSYSPSWGHNQYYRRGFGGGYWSDDYMDDLYDRNQWGFGRRYWGGDFMDDLYDTNQYGRGWM